VNRTLLIFDLDGTLVDSQKDLTSSVNYVRLQFGLPQLSESQVAAFIGDGALMLVRRALEGTASEDNVQAALQLFLSYYREHMLDQSDLYPGVRSTLERLQDCTMAVLTNKPVRFSTLMLDGLGILDRFAVVYGGNSFERKKPDPIGILRILADTDSLREKTWMIGDSATDVLTGRNAGVTTCGVTWGYAADTFEHTPPDYTIHRFADLEMLIR
jgi:phosphoglycolate phosphatase